MTWGSLLRPVGIHIGQLNGELESRPAWWRGAERIRIDCNEHDLRRASIDGESGIKE
jgi:hypothetical protein